MSDWEKANPFAVTDRESAPPCTVTRYARREQAEWYLAYLREHGGAVTRAKVDRGGYAIEGTAQCESREKFGAKVQEARLAT